jgi:excisionase family DNA binding protein
MASRGRLLARPGRAVRAGGAPGRPRPRGDGALLYTAQDVARYCEVDLKTIHHWADAGKIPHHRTEGRHLRFRHRHLVEFLRAHGYPLHDELASARPTLFYALGEAAIEVDPPITHDDVVRKLATRFQVQRFPDALVAIAHLVAGEPDVLVLRAEDPTWSGPPAIEALKRDRETAWPAIAIVSSSSDATMGDLVIGMADLGRLHLELARLLGLGPP